MTLVLVDFVAMKVSNLYFFVKPFEQHFHFLVFMNCLDLMYLIDLNLKPDSITNCVVKPKGSLQKKNWIFYVNLSKGMEIY